MNAFIQPVPLEKAYRLINHGPTTLVSACHQGVENVMPASWVCAVESQPAKLSVVLDKKTFTRSLIEQNGYFVVQIPVQRQLDLIMKLAQSYKDNADKMQWVKTFYQDGYDVPCVEGCAGWLMCRVIPEPQVQQSHDLFVAEVVAAWADERIFKEGHWQFDEADEGWKTLHYIAGGQFYTIGQGVQVG